METLKEIGKAVLIGLIVEGIILLISFLVNIFGVGFPFNLLLMELPFWIMLLVILVLLSSIVMYFRTKYRSREISVRLGRQRPRHDVSEFFGYYFGVKWRVLYGSFLHNSEPYAFCEPNPYCPNPKCMYEMEAERRGRIFKRWYWRCDRCGEYYKCPTKHPNDASETVERMLEADIRSGRLKLP